jgi:hypothetical protein
MRIAMSLMFVAALGCSRSEAPTQPAGSPGPVPSPGSSSTPPPQAPGASGRVPSPGSSSTPTPFREGIDLADSQSALENGQLSDRFDFSRMRELWVRTKVAGLSGIAVVHLTLTTPSGSTLYESSVAYSPDPSQNTMMVPNAPHPITVFRAQAMSGGYGLSYVVPVAGSAMARYPVPGKWHVAATFESGRVLATDIDVTYSP